MESPDSRVTLEAEAEGDLMNTVSHSHHGLVCGDRPRMRIQFWELYKKDAIWINYCGTVRNTQLFGGKNAYLRWCNGTGAIKELKGATNLETHAWNKAGVVVSSMSELPVTFYTGMAFDNNTAVITADKLQHLPAIWCFCSSPEYNQAVREIDQSLKVTNATLVKVPFDLDRWQKVADEQYPKGLPKPYSDDPTQWIYHGHPTGSVTWCEDTKWTVKYDLRVDDSVPQVAVARLLGYQWPAELDSEMELAAEQREWIEESKKLLSFADDDGIVCLAAVRGEKPADQRLEELLQAAYGDAWSTQIRNQLLEAVGCKNKSLSFWLREKFFDQHCKLFQHRPFIWHMWDGLKDGFSALVNYHQLDKKNLERLIYTYLDDWIRTQSHQQADGVDGAAERLVAANNLKERLELILEGEAPYDIFVRWKPLEEQPIGWNPDLNDGVRLNIRPFVTAGVLRHNKKPKLNIHWNKDRGKDVESAPWCKLGLECGGKEGDRINDHHLSLAEKHAAKKA